MAASSCADGDEGPPGTACGDYGKRLVVQVVDELATVTPHRVFATVTKSASTVDEGFRDVTFRQLADAANYVAWFIDNKFGRSNNFEVLGYLGLSDIRYAVYLLAAIKTGYQLMMPSIRNSLSQQIAVFKNAKCSKVFCTPEFDARVDEVRKSKLDLDRFLVPSLDELIGCPPKHYEYNKTYAEAEKDPIYILHSSGSTGNPKPTTATNACFNIFDNHRKVPPIPGRRVQSYALCDFDGGGKFFCPFPPFHVGGLSAYLAMTIFYNATVVTGPPKIPASGEMLSKAMKKIKIRGLFCPPVIVQQLCACPGGFEQAASLDWILYAGGPLAPAIGDKLTGTTDLIQIYGSTETSPLISLVPKKEHWAYIEWHPEIASDMQPMGDGTYEAVIHNDPSLYWARGLFHSYPNIKEYRTRDLFVQHPDNPKLWRFVGRKDDVLVLSNGEKFNPVDMEGVITGYPKVAGALIVGTARLQASLILEPTEDNILSDKEFIASVWPTVEEANTYGPGHGRIFQSKVVVAKKEKPFMRAGKGTIIRSQTTTLYADEVDELYKDENVDTDKAVTLDSSDSVGLVVEFVTTCIQRLLPRVALKPDDDFFVTGMDSLITSELANMLQSGLKSQVQDSSSFEFGTGHIYGYPTIRQLSKHVYEMLKGKTSTNSPIESDRVSAMAAMVEKYTADLPTVHRSRGNQGGVAITGTTGSLGPYLLQALMKDDGVSKVYCLDRTEGAKTKHQEDFKKRGKNYNFDEVEFLVVKLGDPRLDLSEQAYNDLSANVDAVIHNAWTVNFNHKLLSFEENHIRGVRNLVDLSLGSPRQPHFFFVSSISSVENWPNVRGSRDSVPEEIPDDYNLASTMGYAESKHVSERIVAEAAKKSGLKASILRVGQIAGPLRDEAGEWNKAEWLPSLIKTSKVLGCLPDSMPIIDWIPVDALADIITEIVQSDQTDKTPQVFNVINPAEGKWFELAKEIQHDGISTPLKLVPWPEWLRALRSVKEPDMEAMPALKIIEFYERIAMDAESHGKQAGLHYDTMNGMNCSETMAKLKPIDAAAMKTWLKQWNF